MTDQGPAADAPEDAATLSFASLPFEFPMDGLAGSLVDTLDVLNATRRPFLENSVLAILDQIQEPLSAIGATALESIAKVQASVPPVDPAVFEIMSRLTDLGQLPSIDARVLDSISAAVQNPILPEVNSVVESARQLVNVILATLPGVALAGVADGVFAALEVVRTPSLIATVSAALGAAEAMDDVAAASVREALGIAPRGVLAEVNLALSMLDLPPSPRARAAAQLAGVRHGDGLESGVESLEETPLEPLVPPSIEVQRHEAAARVESVVFEPRRRKRDLLAQLLDLEQRRENRELKEIEGRASAARQALAVNVLVSVDLVLLEALIQVILALVT